MPYSNPFSFVFRLPSLGPKVASFIRRAHAPLSRACGVGGPKVKHFRLRARSP